jgi:hypothetical protein
MRVMVRGVPNVFVPAWVQHAVGRGEHQGGRDASQGMISSVLANKHDDGR